MEFKELLNCSNCNISGHDFWEHEDYDWAFCSDKCWEEWEWKLAEQADLRWEIENE